VIYPCDGESYDQIVAKSYSPSSIATVVSNSQWSYTVDENTA